MNSYPSSKSLKKISDTDLSKYIEGSENTLVNLNSIQKGEYIEKNRNYLLTSGNLSLLYFGARHLFEPDNMQFEAIQSSFYSFTKNKSPQSVVVLVEGSVPETSEDLNKDIHTFGERGFITHLCREAKIEVTSIEPSRLDEVKYLLLEFSPEIIEYYYYLRAIRDYFRPGRIQGNTSFIEYSSQILKGHLKMFWLLEPFKNYTFSMEQIKKTHFKITNEEFDINKRLDVNPRNQETIIGQVAHKASSFRDLNHVRRIEQYLNIEKNVFVVNGAEHAVIQKSALEYLMSI